ncbi:MAG: carboxypeptidase-like regulatory domain-containing protein, partial [Terriglobia bacterium]
MNQSQLRRMASILWVALVCMGKLAFPQTAQITGRIADSSGAMVPAAEVEVINVGTGIKQGASSNEEGYYTVPL